MRRENIPAILMLTAGAVTCIITLIMNYPIWVKLLSLLIVMLVFYFLGSILQWMLNEFEIQNDKRNKEEGEVIEKEAKAEEGKTEEKTEEKDATKKSE